MSQFENYKKRVEEGAKKLANTPAEPDQNVLWLKAYILEKLNSEKPLGSSLFVGEDETFGFKESTVNAIIWHAFQAGVQSKVDAHTKDTKDLNDTINKMVDLLEDYIYRD